MVIVSSLLISGILNEDSIAPCYGVIKTTWSRICAFKSHLLMKCSLDLKRSPPTCFLDQQNMKVRSRKLNGSVLLL